jgi:hypothetical protein
MFDVFSSTLKHKQTLKRPNLSVQILIVCSMMFIISCQSEQMSWSDEWKRKELETRNPRISEDLDKKLAYINKFPKDTLYHFDLLKNSIAAAIKSGDEEVTYQLILFSLKKYPKIIQDEEMKAHTLYCYHEILHENETGKWVNALVDGDLDGSEKKNYFFAFAKGIEDTFPKPSSFHEGKQLISMAKIHSLLFPKNEESPEFLWKTHELMLLMGSETEALNLLDLIIIRHKNWRDTKKAKISKEQIIKKMNKEWFLKNNSTRDPDKNNQLPVS